MTENQTILNLDRLTDQAAIWFQRMSDTEVDEQTQAEFYEWLTAEDAHLLAYEEYSTLWNHPDLDDVLQEFADEEEAAGFNIWSHQSWKMIAASFIILLMVGVLSFHQNWFTETGTEYQTAIGEIRNITLSDGTVISLNTDTKMRVLYGDQRMVYLTQGEAYFEVVKDGRAFIVEGGTGHIKVLGTAFSAKVSYNKMVVQVDHGKVSVRPISSVEGQEKLLLKQDRLSVTDEKLGTIFKVTEEVADWRDGWLDVNDKPLVEVVQELDRYYKGAIHLGESDIWNLRVTGRFNLKNIKKAVRLLGNSMDLNVSITKNNEIIIG